MSIYATHANGQEKTTTNETIWKDVTVLACASRDQPPGELVHGGSITATFDGTGKVPRFHCTAETGKVRKPHASRTNRRHLSDHGFHRDWICSAPRRKSCR